MLCLLAASYDYDWQEAAHQFPLATVDSASPWCHFVCGVFYLAVSGRRNEAVAQLERAVQKDPLHTHFRLFLGFCLDVAGRYSEADEQYHQTLDLDPGYVFSLHQIALSYAARGRVQEALHMAERAVSGFPWYMQVVGLYAGLLVRSGELDRGRELSQRMGSGEATGTPLGWAIFHICCGEIDEAAAWIERAFQEQHPNTAVVLQYPIMEPLRSSPHWPKLAAMMRMPS
jgi:tetratricopeptide (TPR) repeat protein